MKRIAPLVTAACLLAACLLPGRPAAAEDGRGGEFGLLLGAAEADDALTAPAAGSTEPVIGLRGGSVFGPHWIWYIDGVLMTADTGSSAGEARSYVGRMGLEWFPGSRTRWFLTGAAGWMTVDYDRSGTADFHRPLVSGGLGQRISLGGRHRLRWELRHDVTIDDTGLSGESLSRSTALVGWVFGPPRRAAGPTRVLPASQASRPRSGDADGDGVPDRRDRCSGTGPGLEVDRSGCPADLDRDGVGDEADLCPRTRYGITVDATGCPIDADGDGVPDTSDACPDTPDGATVDDWGCPGDSDRDGVPNLIDACDDTPPGAAVDATGCPTDGDADGVLDGLDRCPDSPRGSAVGVDGCPRSPATP